MFLSTLCWICYNIIWQEERDSLQQTKKALEEAKTDLTVKKNGLEAQLKVKQDDLKEARVRDTYF